MDSKTIFKVLSFVGMALGGIGCPPGLTEGSRTRLSRRR